MLLLSREIDMEFPGCLFLSLYSKFCYCKWL